MKEYVGIVDTEGLDRFEPLTGESMGICQIRATCNPHRHACVFIASFDDKLDPTKIVRQSGDPWDMWHCVQVMCHELKCEPHNAKTIKNLKKLATVTKQLTQVGWED